MKNTWKKSAAFLLALTITAGSAVSGGQFFGQRGLFDTAITASAECYQTVSGNSTNITYSTDDGHVVSIVTNFTYVDSGNIANNPGTRYYNIIFTTNKEKAKSLSTAWQSGKSFKDLASQIGSDSIYINSNAGSSNVKYERITNAQAKQLTNANVLYDTGYNTKVTGTYTLIDTDILGKFQDGVTYYGMLCSSTGSGSWYTGVYSEIVYHSIDPSMKYTVTYDGNGNTDGTAPTDTKEYTSEVSAVVLGNTGNLEKSGYIFKCWNTNADGSGTSYNEGDPVTLNSDITLYAQWEEIPSDYTITIPATLDIANAGWNELNGGITAKGTLANGKVLTVTAESKNGWALKSGENTVGYNLAKKSGTYSADAAVPEWVFGSLNADGVTQTAGAIVEDYSSKPAGEYEDTVTFTASIK